MPEGLCVGPGPRPGVSRARPVVALLLAVAVATATGGVLLGTLTTGEQPTRAAFSLSARADGTVRLVHRGGPPLSPSRLRLRVLVDGTPLVHQPPVPFFAAEGFRAGPTGPFNAAHEGRWRPGETAGFRVAATNTPTLRTARRVTVTVLRDDETVWRGSAVVGGVGEGHDGRVRPVGRPHHPV